MTDTTGPQSSAERQAMTEDHARFHRDVGDMVMPGALCAICRLFDALAAVEKERDEARADLAAARQQLDAVRELMESLRRDHAQAAVGGEITPEYERGRVHARDDIYRDLRALLAVAPTGDALVWCLTCQDEHIRSIPSHTWRCEACGFGVWDDAIALAHSVKFPGHVVYPVRHQIAPTGDAPTTKDGDA